MIKNARKLANSRVNVVSLPLERLRHSFPRFLSGGGLGGEKRGGFAAPAAKCSHARGKMFARSLQNVRTPGANPVGPAHCSCWLTWLYLMARLVVLSRTAFSRLSLAFGKP